MITKLDLTLLREEHRMIVFENIVLRRMFGLQKNEFVGGWITLHTEELHNSYSSPNIIRMVRSRRMKWAGHLERMRAKRIAYKILVRKPVGKILLGRSTLMWGIILKGT
jgi:hypothetical protein